MIGFYFARNTRRILWEWLEGKSWLLWIVMLLIFAIPFAFVMTVGIFLDLFLIAIFVQKFIPFETFNLEYNYEKIARKIGYCVGGNKTTECIGVERLNQDIHNGLVESYFIEQEITAKEAIKFIEGIKGEKYFKTTKYDPLVEELKKVCIDKINSGYRPWISYLPSWKSFLKRLLITMIIAVIVLIISGVILTIGASAISAIVGYLIFRPK